MPPKIFIAGICGTFMAGLAQLARERGWQVRGCDAGVYPPMSDLLAAQGIAIAPGYCADHLGDDPGEVVIGNALSRGNALVEAALNRGLDCISGPEWLRREVLARREVIAVAGTHGKTSTASMLAWILHRAGRAPGYLIGGQPGNFAASASLGDGENDAPFVIEADEYDTAFFDKRAKFVHYRPRIAVLNNLEFDHADIYDDLSQIARQFHHLVRLVPGDGCVVVNADDDNLARVIGLGCWSRQVKFSANDAGADWFAAPLNRDCSRFEISRSGRPAARVQWSCIGRHNMQNALAATAAAALAGVAAADSAAALRDFRPPARRLQLLFASDSAVLYDDFAHHPTAIRETIAAARARHPASRIIAVVELRSNSMRAGAHGEELPRALAGADCVIVCGGGGVGDDDGGIVRCDCADETFAEIHRQLAQRQEPNRPTVVIIMSNGDFGGLARRLAESLA